MGSLFSTLSKSDVQQPNGDTQYFNSPEAATAAASSKLPSADAILGPNVLNPNPIAPALPKVGTPSFAEANNAPTSNALTTKGKALSLLLTGLAGAVNGAAISANGSPRTGYPGAGAAAGAGFQTPFILQQQRNEMANEGLEQDLKKAQIQSLPLMQQAQRDHLKAETENQTAQAARRGNYTIPGVGLVDGDGNVIKAEPTVADKSKSTLEVKKQEAKDANMDPEQALQYVYGVKPTKEHVTEFEAYVAKAGGDPAKAIDLQQKDKLNNQIAFHRAIQKSTAVEDGLTALQKSTLNSDPEYASLKAEQATLSRKLGDFDADPSVLPDEVAKARQNASDLVTKLNSAKSRVLEHGPAPSNATPLAQRANASGGKTVKQLDKSTAANYLSKAGGDKNKARALAKADGWSF